jgi:hypothetical protein
MNKPWQVWLALVAIFAVGGVCGWQAGYQVARRDFRHPPPPREVVVRRIERIGRKMNLTPEQRARIWPIVERYTEELTKAWRQSFSQSREIIERMEKEIEAELTPEQRARFDQFRQKHRERFKKMMQEGDPHGERPPGPPPGEEPPPPPPDPPEKSTGT